MSAEVMLFPTVRHQCSACKKSWAQKGSAVRHIEHGCVSDPDVRACKTCVAYEGPGECAKDALPNGLDWQEPWTKNCPSWEAKP